MAFAAIVCIVDNDMDSVDADTSSVTVEVDPTVEKETEFVKKTLSGAIAVDGVTDIVLKGDVVSGVATTNENKNSADYTVITKKITLDLNGHDITFKGYGFRVNSGGDLTINGTGTITGGSYNEADYENLPLTTFSGKVTINGGSFVSTSCQECIFAHGTAEVTINGGTFKSTVPGDEVKGYLLNVGNSGTPKIIVKGGTFYDYDPSTGDDANANAKTFIPTGYFSKETSESSETTPIYSVFRSDATNSEASITIDSTTTYFHTLLEAVTFASTMENEQSIVLINDVIIDNDLTVTTDSIELNGHVITINKNVTLNSLITNGDANKAVMNVTGGENEARISQGSIVLTGDYTSSGDLITVNSGEVKISGTVESALNIVVAEGAKLVIPEGKTLDVGNYAVTVNYESAAKATLVVYGSVNAGTGSFTVDSHMTVAVSPNADTSKISGTPSIESVYAESGDRTGYKGTIDGNTEINGQAFLSDNLTIAAGVTLTINGDLSLNGMNLIVKGNLVINSKGSITGIGATGGVKDTITIDGKGTITNDGIIGKGNFPVTIKSGEQSVSLKAVSGAQISTDKSANLLVSGTISKISGASDAKITVSGAILSGDVTISKNVTLDVVADSSVAKNGTLVINGKLSISGGQKLILKEGSTITVNGTAVGVIAAEVKDAIPAGQATAAITTYTKIAVDELSGHETATGYTISVERIQYTDDAGNVYFNQTAHLSGAIKNSDSKSVRSVPFTISGNNIFIDEDVSVTVGKYVTLNTASPSYIIVEGSIVNVSDEINFIGAYYEIEESATETVGYIESFDGAFSKIDTVDNKEIVLSGVDGKEIEINGNYVIKENQIVSLKNETESLIIIGENCVVTVEENGELDADVIKKINGKLIVMDGAICSPGEGLYDVMSKNDNNDVTYAGFQVIINDAKEGDVITIIGDNATVSSVTIPKGVEVVVEGKLLVEKNLAVAEGGKITLDGGYVTVGTETVPGTVKNAGTINTTSGTLTLVGGTDSKKAVIDTTGDLICIAAYNFGTNVTLNGAKYVDSDNNTVITTVSRAVDASAAAGTNAVTVIGDVKDTSDITLGKVLLTIDTGAEAVLGTIDVNGAKIVANGLLTASIKGQFGDDGNTSDAVLKVTKATITSITNTSKVNSQNVKVWSVNYAGIVGSVEFVKGTIVAGTITAPEAEVIEKPVIKIDSDATLSVESELTITGFDKVVIDGTIYVAKTNTFALDKATVNGTVIVDGTATINDVVLLGTLKVTDTEDVTGTLNIPGSLKIGEIATTGASPSIEGTVTLGDDAFALVYDGVAISASSFGSEDAVYSTQFYINGVPYATAYAVADDILAIGTDVPNNGFMNDVKMEGYDVTQIGDASAWFTDVDCKKPFTADDKFYVGEKSSMYFKAVSYDAKIQFSVGEGMSLWVDGVKVTSSNYGYYAVGEHTVSVTINPGFKGTTQITFNGATVSNGKIVITADMVSEDRATATAYVLSATGDITVDSGDIPAPTPIQPSEKDDSMGITEYLLIVLVILAAILVVVVAIRMMRS